MVPQENIVWGARIHLDPDRLTEPLRAVLGCGNPHLGPRPAAGETVPNSAVLAQFPNCGATVNRLYLEQGRYTGGESVLAAHWDCKGQPASATLLAAGRRRVWLLICAALEPSAGEARVSVQSVDGVLVCRYLGPSATYGLASLRPWHGACSDRRYWTVRPASRFWTI